MEEWIQLSQGDNGLILSYLLRDVEPVGNPISQAHSHSKSPSFVLLKDISTTWKAGCPSTSQKNQT